MSVMPLLGTLALLYAVLVIEIALKKPSSMWNMKKIRRFRNSLGEKRTEIFFYIWGAAFAILGIWLLIK